MDDKMNNRQIEGDIAFVTEPETGMLCGYKRRDNVLEGLVTVRWNGSLLEEWVDGVKLGPRSGGTGSTITANLTVANRTPNTLDVASDVGNDATLPAATSALAGLMSAADKTKLDGITGGAGTPGASVPTNLAVAARGTTTLDVTSDTGTDATLPAATSALAGLMSAADKTKLDGLSGAAGGGAPVSRKVNVVANGVTGAVVLVGFGTQAQLDAATVTPSANGDTITVAGVAAAFVLASVSAHLPDSFSGSTTTSFSFVLPANFGVTSIDSLPLVDLARFNLAGMRQAQTNVGVEVIGSTVKITQTGLSGGTPGGAGTGARFKATAL